MSGITQARSVGSVLLGHKFRMEFNDYNVALIQKCKFFSEGHEVVKFAGGGQDTVVKQAGGRTIDEMRLEVIVAAAGTERTFWRKWHQQCRTGDVKQYYRDATLIQLGPNDEPSVVHDIEDIWVGNIEMEELDAEPGEVIVKLTITLQCNDFDTRAK